MEIKGLSVKTIPEFINEQFKDRYTEWFNALPAGSQSIFGDLILTNKWYPISDALISPIKTVAKVFYGGDEKTAAWYMGRQSAEFALKGIYKIYVKIGNPLHIIDRASRIMAAYFNPSEIEVVKKEKSGIIVHITLFPEPDIIVDYNIAGWIERALEISGCKNIKIEIPKSLALKNEVTEFKISWAL